AAKGYLARLIGQGFKVAICDQMEEAGKSPLVKREVTRVVTPGMILDDALLDPREPSYLAAVAFGEGPAGFALLDASTGELRCGEVGDEKRLAEELQRAEPRELLFARAEQGTARSAALAKQLAIPAAFADDADFERAE